MSYFDHWTRRQVLGGLAGLGATALLPASIARAATPEPGNLILRTIPGTDEQLPVSGMGSARTFNVDDPDDPETLERLKKVLQAFYDGGGRVLDTSPMYGNAEIVLGKLMKELGLTDKLWIATKVWTRGKQAGIEQMERSLERLGRDRLELIQVHNLKDTQTHLETLRAWKDEGRIRYLGATHYREDHHDELLELIRREELDFLQFNYNLNERNADEELLPACADRGVATLINEPYNKGNLFRQVGDRPLPDWASELGCQSWAQLFLKYLIGHPAVTAVIPATGDPEHAAENAAAGRGAVPDEAMRERIRKVVAS
jgi:aryl-alcohol dehydrogenase-like predicted oxidoreductase